MTSPGPARPARLAGFVLLGVAVVAVGLGVFSLTSGGGQATGGSTTTPGTSSTTAPPTSPTTRSTTTPPTSASSTSPAGPTTTVAPPPVTTTAPAGGPPGVPQVPVRVFNNSTIKGLAAEAAGDFQQAGFDVVQVGNYAQSNIPTTTAYYTNQPGEQATAQALAQQFGMQTAPRFPGIAFDGPGVVVIVTNDFKGQPAPGGK